MMKRIKIFTLVELIVVIGIIAVLGVISILMVSEWMGKSRDSRRKGDVSQINKALDISMVKSATFPMPDGEKSYGLATGAMVAIKGVYGETVNSALGMMKTVPKDPVSDGYYTYSVSNDQKQYQIAYTLENKEKVAYRNEVYAKGGVIAGVDGNYKGVMSYSTGGKYYIGNFPSIVWSNEGSGVDLLSTGTYYVVNKKENLPYKVESEVIKNKSADIMIKETTNISGAVLTGIDITSSVVGGVPLSTLISGNTLVMFGGTGNVNVGNVVLGNNTVNSSNSISCNSGYVLSGNGCVQNICGGSIPVNGSGNSTSQSAGQNWTYNTTQGMCTFVCNNNYTWNGSSCAANTQNFTCSMSTGASFYNGSTSYTITQTWNGSAWLPSSSRIYNVTPTVNTCEFKCDSGYSWNGNTCQVSVPTSCLSLKNSGTNTDGIYSIDPDGVGGNPAYNVYCDMTSDGGGWTLIMYSNGAGGRNNVSSSFNFTSFSDPTNQFKYFTNSQLSATYMRFTCKFSSTSTVYARAIKCSNNSNPLTNLCGASSGGGVLDDTVIITSTLNDISGDIGYDYGSFGGAGSTTVGYGINGAYGMHIGYRDNGAYACNNSTSGISYVRVWVR